VTPTEKMLIRQGLLPIEGSVDGRKLLVYRGRHPEVDAAVSAVFLIAGVVLVFVPGYSRLGWVIAALAGAGLAVAATEIRVRRRPAEHQGWEPGQITAVMPKIVADRTGPYFSTLKAIGAGAVTLAVSPSPVPRGSIEREAVAAVTGLLDKPVPDDDSDILDAFDEYRSRVDAEIDEFRYRIQADFDAATTRIFQAVKPLSAEAVSQIRELTE
jgi:hypothetical protein